MKILAEQKDTTNNPIEVELEIEGEIPPNWCHLDHLFTKPENSLEATKTLNKFVPWFGPDETQRRLEMLVAVPLPPP